MGDWPSYPGLRLPHLTVTNLGSRCAADFLVAGVCPAFASAAWPSANRALLYPVSLDAPFTAARMFWVNGGTVSGNVDAGLYDASGHRLGSTGSTAQAGTSALQSAALTASVGLAPGTYYLALAVNNTTATFYRTVISFSTFTWAGAASAFALPATVTLAAAGFDYSPLLGMSSGSIP